jgi:D-alanyl-D-alanine dipeptidase
MSAHEKMWDACPDPNFVALPKKGSNHSRGIAVDVTLVDIKTGKEVEMPTKFDDFSEKARIDYNKGITEDAKKHRNLLQQTMKDHNFIPYSREWWHFSYTHYPYPCPLLTIEFKELHADSSC